MESDLEPRAGMSLFSALWHSAATALTADGVWHFTHRLSAIAITVGIGAIAYISLKEICEAIRSHQND